MRNDRPSGTGACGLAISWTSDISRLHVQLSADPCQATWMLLGDRIDEDTLGEQRIAAVAFQRDGHDDPLAEEFPVRPIPLDSCKGIEMEP